MIVLGVKTKGERNIVQEQGGVVGKVNILELILRIILLILSGIRSVEAVKDVAEESGEDFDKLWANLPDKYK